MYYITIRGDQNDCLSYYCRLCGHVDTEMTEDVICVINTQIKKENPHFDQIVNKYTKFDPTLPRIYNLPCPNKNCQCSNELADDKEQKPSIQDLTNKNQKSPSNEVLYIRYNDNDMKYLYLCCKCDHIWSK